MIAGASTNTSSSIIPMLDVAYYLTKNWAIEAICCVAPHHIQGTGTIASDFARAWLFPPSIMAQYHFTNFGAFQPYLGVGVNFTTFWNTRVNNDTWGIPFAPGSALAGLGIPGVLSSFQYATVAPSWGVVGQAGVDYMFNEHWGVNVDFKYIGLHPMVHSTAVVLRAGSARSWSDLHPGQGVAADQSDRHLGGSHLSLRRQPPVAAVLIAVHLKAKPALKGRFRLPTPGVSRGFIYLFLGNAESGGRRKSSIAKDAEFTGAMGLRRGSTSKTC